MSYIKNKTKKASSFKLQASNFRLQGIRFGILSLLITCSLSLVACGGLYVDGNLEINSPDANQRHGLILKPQSSAPTSPSEGQIYYNNTNNQTYYYGGSPLQWRNFGQDKHVATRIVAASNSLDQSRANWTCDGIDDQVQIQQAIDALQSKPGVVYLLEGTYNISGSINLNNTAPLDSGKAIIGTGAGTVLRVFPLGTSNVNVINASNVDRILVSQLMIDGNNKTGSNNNGILFNSVTYSKIDKVWVEIMSGDGIRLTNSSNNNSILGNNLQANGGDGIDFMGSSNNNSILGNNIQANSDTGITWSTSSNNTLTANNIQSNNKYGIYLMSDNSGTPSSNNTITGNNVQSNGQLVASDYGIYLFNHSYNNTVSGNIFWSNASDGIAVSGPGGLNTNHIIIGNNVSINGRRGIWINGASSNTISGNVVWSNGGTGNYDGIAVGNVANNNIISSNLLFDSSGSGYPISINWTGAAASSNNYLMGNLISAWPILSGSIRDTGTNTMYTDRVKITLERQAILSVTGSTITPTGPASYLPVVGSGGPKTVTTITAGSNVAVGSMLILEGTNDTNTVTIQDTGNVKLSCDIPPCSGSRSRPLGLNDVLTLIWDGTNWLELSWSNN